MSDVKQKTIAASITLQGVGLHTGRKCKATFLPAPENAGITFVRVDLPGKPSFRAHVDNVVDIVRGTTLGSGDEKVYTIEHILSALNGLDVDNLTVEIDDNEPPVLDGSAQGFVEAIRKVGIVAQSADKNFFTVESPIEYKANQSILRIEPSDRFEVDCLVDYNHPMITNQRFVFRRGDDYAALIAPARTFCFDYEIEALKKNGLAKGGSMDNAIVVGPEGIYNPGDALRFKDEFVRHKILDLMGDLMLLGRPLRARIVAVRCGHGHNVKFLRQILSVIPAQAGIQVSNTF
jgi:UDP-3-O-acyl N-acetylglucosamine deacetylase